MATISRLLKIIGLFCKRALQKRRNSANETYHLKEPTNRSHPIRTVRHDILICVTWLIDMCVTRLVVMRDRTHLFGWIAVRFLKPRVIWLIGMCDMTQWHVWHNSFVCVNSSEISHSMSTLLLCWDLRGHDSYVYVAGLICMCDMTHWYLWHVSFVR